MDYGFTNDLLRLATAKEFRDAAVADGWTIEPTYKHEPVDRAANLRRDGFAMSVISREAPGTPKLKAQASVHIWGPDGLCIEPPSVYDWTAIVAGVRRCDSCGKTDVDTQRYSFAGRCCADCLPAMRAEHEKPGWCD